MINKIRAGEVSRLNDKYYVMKWKKNHHLSDKNFWKFIKILIKSEEDLINLF